MKRWTKTFIWTIAAIVLIYAAIFVAVSNFGGREDGKIYPETPMAETDDECDCAYNAHECEYFNYKTQTQECFEKCGGVRTDTHYIDENNNRISC